MVHIKRGKRTGKTAEAAQRRCKYPRWAECRWASTPVQSCPRSTPAEAFFAPIYAPITYHQSFPFLALCDMTMLHSARNFSFDYYGSELS